MIYDLIGTIYKPTGKMIVDKEGNEYPQMKAVEGYHVNTVPPLNDELIDYVVKPSHTQRVFAGRDDTICLRFKDRNEWLSLGYEEIENDLSSN